jgi:hypothetical protein
MRRRAPFLPITDGSPEGGAYRRSTGDQAVSASTSLWRVRNDPLVPRLSWHAIGALGLLAPVARYMHSTCDPGSQVLGARMAQGGRII